MQNQLPVGWVWTSIGNIAKVGQGGTPRRNTPSYWNGDIPWIRSGEVNNNLITESKEKITKLGLKESSTVLCPPGTVLLAMTGEGITRGRSAILRIEACANQSVAHMIVDKNCVSEWYLYYYLRSQYWQIRSIEKGTNQPGINTTIVKNLKIPLAPQKEQKRIISKIEELVRESIAARKALDKVPQIMKRFRQSVLISAFGGKLIKSSEWRLVKLRAIIESLQPGFACGKRDENGFIQLRMNNIGLNGKIVTDSFLRVPKSETNIQKYQLHKGDIIFNNTNSPELVGKTVIFNDEIKDCVYSNHLTRIRINSDLALPEFVTNFLMLEQKKGTFELLCRRFVGQAAVPRESLLNLDFSLPPLKEQKQIILKVEELFSLANQIGNSMREARERSDKIDQSILTKAFRGELVQQDPNDEPAEKLLEKVKSQTVEIKSRRKKS